VLEELLPKSGHFQAIGWEGGISRIGAISYLVLLLGSLQFLVFLFLPEFPSFGPISSVSFFYLSLAISISSIAGLFMSGIRFTRVVGAYDVSFEDHRQEGKNLELTYLSQRGIKRVSVPVTGMQPHPKSPLYRPTFSRGVSYVSGTKASLTIKLEHKGGPLRLELGFPSVEEMNIVYEQLRQ
jgi:hypothetical protein